ncbi:Dam family site-specific DNA-(adenine-N6)-methyltransferase [Pseudocolwellia sp. AS88]|jgi:DNA adenine methylase|uniref:Dam family site-specific DNA-(adenine-N6)-methyltransferase n=1 Tax=Pseudocolwellia TaxID=2848177 RepID=UPI0026F345BD|nr:Dam family site-specific DNA-(adenine-N6)-methyltransferase [Pseudocolwellia sp. AS88]MDO7084036.1 Dam family site-specific DNA-(adenine-N6)-methyltransferase [Pseudocolwellia sp. AS88]
MKIKHRAFLKWAGGKYTLSDTINKLLPDGKRLIEPFIGAGSIFLNTDYDEYVLNDINADLINLYKIVQQTPIKFIEDAARLFDQKNNDPEVYYHLRKEFNNTTDKYYRSLLFLYMNRHGYNGLCRYNKSGGYNVPFGKYKKPYFPREELEYFSEKSEKATFVCQGYRSVIDNAQDGDVIYCDPPYVPLSATASFTSYSGNGFGLDEQADLANAAEEIINKVKTSVLISNHDTIWTRKIYEHANKIKSIQVARTISQKGGGRKKAAELLALYHLPKTK